MSSSGCRPDSRIRSFAQIDDPDRLAHVEHEDLAAAAERAGLQHQLHRLRDGHEVAAHLRVRDRHRPAGLRSAAGTSAPRCRGCRARCRTAPRRSSRSCSRRRCCTISSATRLVAPMTLRRAHRLVGRDEHEALRAAAAAPRRRRCACRATLLLIASTALLFHQRHVLVRRGVEHDVRAGAAAKTRVDPPRVAHVGDHRHDSHVGERRAQLALDARRSSSRRGRAARAAPGRAARSAGTARCRSSRRRR